MLGALLGLSVVGLEAVSIRVAFDGGEAAAIVNDVEISRSDYRHALNLLSSVRGGAITPAERRQVLDRLVEEELLFQRAEAIGLMRNHGNLRASIVQAMVSFILDDGSSSDRPSDEVLKKFYKDHQARFVPSGRWRVSRIYLRPGETQRAQKIAERLNAKTSDSIDSISLFDELAKLGDPVIVNVPDILLPYEKLLEYAGEILAAHARVMKPGDIKGPIKTPSGIYFLLLRAQQDPQPPRFDDIKPQIARYYARRRDDQMLKDYIERLRDDSDIRVFP